MNALSKSVHVLAWIVCILSSYMTLVALSFFSSDVGWAGIGLLMMLKFYLPACLLFCIAPAAYLAFRNKNPRDRRSLWLAVIPTVMLPIALFLALKFAPHGNGC